MTSNPTNANATATALDIGRYPWLNGNHFFPPRIDATEPKMLAPTGWHCPGCGHYYAPSVTVCPETHE